MNANQKLVLTVAVILCFLVSMLESVDKGVFFIGIIGFAIALLVGFHKPKSA